MALAKYLFISSRPRQWLKNFIVFSAIVFAGELFNPDKLFPVIGTFFIFSLLVSGSYILNDILDSSKDRLHHLKKYRPIAAGKLSAGTASIFAGLITALGLLLSLMVSETLFAICLLFVLIQILYSFYLKKIKYAIELYRNKCI